MKSLFVRKWWSFVLRGIAAILFGVLAFMTPGITLASLVLLYGAYALVDGVVALAGAFTKRGPVAEAIARPRWMLVLHGLFGIAAGLFTFFYPGITTIALLAVIAAWAFCTGVLEIVAAVKLRKEIEGEWLMGLGGLLSIAFGVMMLAWPTSGAVAVVWMIGAYALMFGVVLITLGVRLRSFQKEHPEDFFSPTQVPT